ncbi:MAG: hypothetical protein WBW48_16660 [Anaerolineae bacterium]
MQRSKELDRSTTIYNLYELCGILISSGRLAEGRALFEEYVTSKDIEILYPKITLFSERRFWAVHNEEIMKRVERGMRVGDAAVLWAAESNACEIFVTWNTKHFAGKTAINVQTPEEWLAEHSKD